jgi:hypothetical protein
MWPQVPSNINLIMEAITAISKGKLCKSRPHPAFSAYLWLDRQIEFARQQGITIDGFFFRDGGYTRVNAPPEEPKNEYKPPTKEELAALEVWKRSEEYAALRKQWQDLDKKLNMTRVIRERPVTIPALPPDEEKKILERYTKKV